MQIGTGCLKKVSLVETTHNFCYRPRIRLSNMSFGMRKARFVHLRHKNCMFRHSNCLKINCKGRRQRDSYLFSDFKRICVRCQRRRLRQFLRQLKCLNIQFLSLRWIGLAFLILKLMLESLIQGLQQTLWVISTKLTFFETPCIL